MNTVSILTNDFITDDVERNFYFFKKAAHARDDFTDLDFIIRRKISKLCLPPLNWHPRSPVESGQYSLKSVQYITRAMCWNAVRDSMKDTQKQLQIMLLIGRRLVYICDINQSQCVQSLVSIHKMSISFRAQNDDKSKPNFFQKGSASFCIC